MGSRTEWRRQRKEYMNLKERSIETSYSEIQREKRLGKKMIRAAETFGTISKVHWSPDKVGERELGKKYILKTVIATFAQIYKFTDLRSSEIQKKINSKKTTF